MKEYEIMNITKSGVTKENVIKLISDKLNIKLEDITAFWDDYADIGMFKMVGLGIAMGNAIDDVKKIADIIIDTNDNDGIGKYLNRILTK